MNIDLTDREIELLMAALGARIGTLEQHPDASNPQLAELITELFELETDLREAVNRQDDGWGDPDDPDLLMDPVDFAAKHDRSEIQEHDGWGDAETEMFNTGVEARERMKADLVADHSRERMKATSRAAARRALNFSSRTDDDRSEVQKHDVFDHEWNPDDPKNW